MKRAIDVAITQLGVSEATGKNDGIPAERYMRGDELAWCAGFVLFCFDEAGGKTVTHPDKPNEWWRLRSVTNMENSLMARGLWLPAYEIPKRNDIIFFGGKAGSDSARLSGRHCGIVESFEGDTIHTIEGNMGNKVKRVKRRRSDPTISGFGRVYDD